MAIAGQDNMQARTTTGMAVTATMAIVIINQL
jgi:hypothetical protein